MAEAKPTIGFCGLGAMGFGMAVNLVNKGYKVKGFDVFPKSIERFKEAGGIATASLKESAEGCEYYVCMVANAIQAQSVIFTEADALAKTLPTGSLLLLCSTVPSSYAVSVQDQLNELGRSDIYFVDCPVSGGSTRAAAGTLSIMAGASDKAIAKAKDILIVMSDKQKLFIVQGGIGAGSNMKMVHQVLAGIHILAASEAMGYAAQCGLDLKTTMAAINNSEAWAWMFENRVPRMLEEDYFPGVSALTIILKDVGIVTAMARHKGFPTPLSSVAEQVYMSGLSRDYGSHDDAGMIRVYFPKSLKGLTGLQDGDDFKSALSRIQTLLKGIYLCSTAEAFALTKNLGLSLDQFFELAADAAGASFVFRNVGPSMIRGLNGDNDVWTIGSGGKLRSIIEGLSEVVEHMQGVKFPAFLGAAALNVMLLAEKQDVKGLAEPGILRVWGQWCGL